MALVSGTAGVGRPGPGEARGRRRHHGQTPGGPAAPLAARQAGGAADRPHREGGGRRAAAGGAARLTVMGCLWGLGSGQPLAPGAPGDDQQL